MPFTSHPQLSIGQWQLLREIGKQTIEYYDFFERRGHGGKVQSHNERDAAGGAEGVPWRDSLPVRPGGGSEKKGNEGAVHCIVNTLVVVNGRELPADVNASLSGFNVRRQLFRLDGRWLWRWS